MKWNYNEKQASGTVHLTNIESESTSKQNGKRT